MRAFSSWSVHHPLLHFEDVSAVCDASPRYADADGAIGCEHAEIYVSFMGSRPASSGSSGNAPEADDNRAAVAYMWYRTRNDFRSTNGAASPPMTF